MTAVIRPPTDLIGLMMAPRRTLRQPVTSIEKPKEKAQKIREIVQFMDCRPPRSIRETMSLAASTATLGSKPLRTLLPARSLPSAAASSAALAISAEMAG